MKIYLAGNLVGRDKQLVFLERQKAAQELAVAGLEVFDPVSLEDAGGTESSFGTAIDILDMSKFVSAEKKALSQCGGVLVLTGDSPSDGTWLEIGYALYALHIPVVMVAPRRAEGSLVSWSNVEVNAVVPTVEQAAKVMALLLDRRRT